MTDPRGHLLRVGIDSDYGGWNAPVDPETGDFVYVPIPEEEPVRPGHERPYELAQRGLARFGECYGVTVELPAALRGRNMHLDPDFEHLTYGDVNAKAKRLLELSAGDFLVFYAGLEPRPGTAAPHAGRLVYAVIGMLVLREDPRIVVDEETGEVVGLPEETHACNAHTRRAYTPEQLEDRRRSSRFHRDVLLEGRAGASGRFSRCLDIGSWRDNAYRVRPSLLDRWGGLDGTSDGWIQRSTVMPEFAEPDAFLGWLDEREFELVESNFGHP
jgi:hypothetical protein